MRERVVRGALVLAAAAALAGACGDGSDGTAATTAPGAGPLEGPHTTASDPGPNPTVSDPGPNPTATDPGPNDTSAGPFSEQGTLALDAATGCVAIDTAGGERFDLRLAGYEVAAGEEGGGPALVDASGEAVALPGDEVIVAGYPTDETSACGTRFDVTNLVSVVPAGG